MTPALALGRSLNVKEQDDPRHFKRNRKSAGDIVPTLSQRTRKDGPLRHVFVFSLEMLQYCSVQSGANQRRGIGEVISLCGGAEIAGASRSAAPAAGRFRVDALQQRPTISGKPLNNGWLTVWILGNNRSPRATLCCELRTVFPIDNDRTPIRQAKCLST